MQKNMIFSGAILFISGVLLVILGVTGAFQGEVTFPLHLLRVSVLLASAVSSLLFFRYFYLFRSNKPMGIWSGRVIAVLLSIVLLLMTASSILYLHQLEPNVSDASRDALHKSGLYNQKTNDKK